MVAMDLQLSHIWLSIVAGWMVFDLCLSHGSHNHGKMEEVPKSFHDPKLVENQEHIKEEYEGQANLEENMTREELQFHYFKLHDFDNNTKLDGLEIYQAITHLMGSEDEKDGFNAMNITELIDRVLEEDDVDNDGYLTYPEYVLAGQRGDK